MQTKSIYISDTAVAQRYGVSRATVWRWAQNKQLPEPIKLSPGCTRWRFADLEAWEAKQVGGK